MIHRFLLTSAALLVVSIGLAPRATADDGLLRDLGRESEPRYRVRTAAGVEVDQTIHPATLEDEASVLREASGFTGGASGAGILSTQGAQALTEDQRKTLQRAINIVNRRAGGVVTSSADAGTMDTQSLGMQAQAMASTFAALAPALEESARLARTVSAVQGDRRRLALTSLKELGFSLREGPDDAGNKKPALFSYFRDFEKSDTVWAARFALMYDSPKPKGYRPFSMGFSASVAGNLTTKDKDKKNDAWQIRAGVRMVWDKGGKGAVGRRIHTILSRAQLKYEQSQDGDVRKLSGAVTVDPKVGAWALGVRRGFEYGYTDGRCCPPQNIVSWQWQARGEGNFGSTIDAGDSEEKEGTLVRLRGDLTGTLYLDAIGRAVSGKRWLLDSESIPKIEAGFKGFYHPLEDETFHHFFFVNLKVPLNEVLSISAKYLNGEDAPKFVRTESLFIGLGIQF